MAAEEQVKYPTPALAALRAATAGMRQGQIADRLGCTQSMASEYLGGRSRPGTKGRMLAERHFGIPLSAWFLPSELPPDAAHSASQPATPQADRTSSIPPFSEPAPEAA